MASAEELLVRIDAQTEQLRRELRRADESVGQFQQNTGQRLQRIDAQFQRFNRRVQQAVGAAGALATAFAGRELVQFGADALRSAEQVDRMSRSLDVSRRRVQELTFTFARFGLEQKDVTDALSTLADRAQDAQQGAQGMIDDFRTVGLTVDDLRGKSPAELFDTFARAVANSDDTTAATAATVRILGDEVGQKLLPLIREGEAGLDRFAQQAQRAGFVMDDSLIQRSAEAAARIDQLRLTLSRSFERGILEGVVGEFEDFDRAIVEAGQSAREFGEVAGDALSAAADAAQTVSENAGVAKEVMQGLIGLRVGAAFGPWGAAIGGVAGLLADNLAPAAKAAAQEVADLVDAANRLGSAADEGIRGGNIDGLIRTVRQQRETARQLRALDDPSQGQRRVLASTRDQLRGLDTELRDTRREVRETVDALSALESPSPNQQERLRLARQRLDRLNQTIADVQRPAVDLGQTTFPMVSGAAGDVATSGSAAADGIASMHERVNALAPDLDAAIERLNRLDTRQRALAGAQSAGAPQPTDPTGAADARGAARQRTIDEMRIGMAEMAEANRLVEQATVGRRSELEAFGERVRRDVARPIEEYRQRVARLDEALDAGAITQETYSRAVAQARDRLEQASGATRELERITDQTFDRVGDAITEAFVKGEDAAVSFQSIARGVLSEITQAFVELSTINPLKNAVLGTDSSTLGDVLSGAASAGTGLLASGGTSAASTGVGGAVPGLAGTSGGGGGSLFGFARGGSFTVGPQTSAGMTSDPVDKRIVPIAARDGERVDVVPPEAPKPPAPAPAPAQGGGGAPNVTIEQNITVQANGDEQVAQLAKQAAGQAVREAAPAIQQAAVGKVDQRMKRTKTFGGGGTRT